MDECNINIAIETLKNILNERTNVLKSIVLSNDYSKAEEITFYFFSKLNVEDIYSQKEFYEFVNEVYFMITTN